MLSLRYRTMHPCLCTSMTHWQAVNNLANNASVSFITPLLDTPSSFIVEYDNASYAKDRGNEIPSV